MPDPSRLEEIVRTHENTLYRTALAVLADPEEARDAVQDAFLALLTKDPAFEGPEHQRAWLLRVTVNACKDRLRAQRRHPTLPLLESYPAAVPEEQSALEAVLALPPKSGPWSTSSITRATPPGRSPPSPASGRAPSVPACPVPVSTCGTC